MKNNTNLSLTPLGAGDLIDRAVRFYRRNFWTFVWIAAPPIIVGTLLLVGLNIIGREMFAINSARNPGNFFLFSLFSGIGNLLIWLAESVAVMTVMGGASRNFVRHILFGEPITFRQTYNNIRRRLGGLIVASTLISILLGVIGWTILYLGLAVGAVAVILIYAAFTFSPFLIVILSIIFCSAIAFLTGWLFFLIASRFAYVPQAMLVEDQKISAAFGRSANLASGNVKRFAALFIFTTVATYSALSLFYIPLGWYAYLEGVQIFTFAGADLVPAWYQIATQFISQASVILLMPVWMIGLCLLYIDERVRHEGYDIELMAAQRLGEIPAVPRTFVNPLQPALGQQRTNQPVPPRRSSSMLGLE